MQMVVSESDTAWWHCDALTDEPGRSIIQFSYAYRVPSYTVYLQSFASLYNPGYVVRFWLAKQQIPTAHR